MSVNLGRLARIKLGTDVIAKMTSMSVSFGTETIDITSFGDTHAKFAVGLLSWTASVAGFYDKSDTQQQTLLEAAEDGTELTDIRFYLDSTAYYKVDVITDPEASCIINSLTVNADNNSVVSFDMSITGSGPIAYATG